jgi:hypothetical protein
LKVVIIIILIIINNNRDLVVVLVAKCVCVCECEKNQRNQSGGEEMYKKKAIEVVVEMKANCAMSGVCPVRPLHPDCGTRR